MGIDKPDFAAYLARLAQVSGVDVTDWESLKAAAAQRVDYFHEVGGRRASGS